MGSFDAADWLILIGLGGLVGSLGQGARTIVGLKKLNDAATAQSVINGSPVSLSDLLVTSQLVTSLAIGFVAGALAAAFTATPGAAVSGEQIAGLAAAGYAGADFVEGLISRFSATSGAPAGQVAAGTGAASTAGVTGADEAVG